MLFFFASRLGPRGEDDDVDSGGGEAADASLSQRTVAAERVRAELQRAEEGAEGTGRGRMRVDRRRRGERRRSIGARDARGGRGDARDDGGGGWWS